MIGLETAKCLRMGAIRCMAPNYGLHDCSLYSVE
jgi:hypothetical protein